MCRNLSQLKTPKPFSICRPCGTRRENRHIREVPVCCRFKETGNNRIKFSLGTWPSHSQCQFFIDDFGRNRKMVHSNCFSAGGRFLYCLCHVFRCWCPCPSVKSLFFSGPLWAASSLSAGTGKGYSQAVSRSAMEEEEMERNRPVTRSVNVTLMTNFTL